MRVLRKLVVTLALAGIVGVAAAQVASAAVRLGKIPDRVAEARLPGMGGNTGEPDVGQTASPTKSPEIGLRMGAAPSPQPEATIDLLFALRGWLWATRFPGLGF